RTESTGTYRLSLHDALPIFCGSMERFLGILLENYAGHMPLWFAPVQVVVATITSEADDYAVAVAERMRQAGLAVETDLRNEKIRSEEHTSELQSRENLVCRL